MNIQELLKYGTSILKGAGISEPMREVSTFMCDALGCETVFLYCHPRYELTSKQQDDFLIMLKRRKNGEPIQYIRNYQEFMGLKFLVTPDVLIPRHDTETLVEQVIKVALQKSNPTILDMCTGSGCIAVSIAKYVLHCQVTATDISDRALKIASNNSLSMKVYDRVTLVQGNLFDNIHSTFDIIVSNPPYIRTNDIDTLQPEIKFEPKIALDGGVDGLMFYRHIIKDSVNYLNKDGSILALEVGSGQANEVNRLMQQYNFHNIHVIKDVQHIDRVIIGTLHYGRHM